MIKKTNAVRELDQHKIPYKTKEYEVAGEFTQPLAFPTN